MLMVSRVVRQLQLNHSHTLINLRSRTLTKHHKQLYNYYKHLQQPFTAMSTAASNARVIFTSRPGVAGEPTEKNFAYEPCPYPEENLTPGQVLVKCLYLSVDPAMRCRMNEDTGVEYMKAWEVGKTVQGLYGVGAVVKSNSSGLSVGDVVTNVTVNWPWENYFVLQEDDLMKIDEEMVEGRVSMVISCLGLIGLTSLLGVREKGHLVPGKKQTFLVSGAAGACGTIAGQIARLEGAGRVVGICGSEEKCSFLKKDLSFDAAINYKVDDLAANLKSACPQGIDTYFDNVGGSMSETVIQQMNMNSHVILCGQISQYNKDVPYPPPIPDEMAKTLKEKNITRERYLVFNYKDKFPESLQQLGLWLKEGKLKVRETILEGLDNSGKAYVDMMNGANIGKMLVHVADK